MIYLLGCIKVFIPVISFAIHLGLTLCLFEGKDWELLPQLFNPVKIYAIHKVNYFGCFMIMLAYHIVFPLIAIGYWLYMLGKLFVILCTVGRR